MSKRPVRRHFISGKDVKRLIARVHERLRPDISSVVRKGGVEVADFGDYKLYLVDGIPALLEMEGVVAPTLMLAEAVGSLPKVVVDMGAVPRICNGADVMAPGVTEVSGEFREGELVAIVDEKHGKPIAIGLSLLSSEGMRAAKSGKVVKNLHFVGDDIWNWFKSRGGA